MFELDVISEPGESFGVDGTIPNKKYSELTRYDEMLIKPALILADRVRLFTMREDLIRITESNAFQNTRMPPRFIGYFVHLSLSPDSEVLKLLGLSEKDLASKEDAKRYLESGFDDGLEFMFSNYDEQIMKYQIAFGSILKRRWDDLHSPGIKKAQDAGIVTISSWHGDNDGLRDEERLFQIAFDPHAGKFTMDGIEAMNSHLKSGSNPILLEPGAISLLGRRDETIGKAIPRADVFDPSIQIASALAAFFPGLNMMSIDELIDLRNSLAAHLGGFRACLLELASKVSVEKDAPVKVLARHASILWAKEVVPALEELKYEIQRGTFPIKLREAFASDGKPVMAVGSAISLGVGSIYAGLAALVPAAILASPAFIKAWNETSKAKDEAIQNKLYFLYKAQQQSH